MMSRALMALLVLAAGASVFGLAGCGEREQTAHYEQGRYRGKPDTPPYQSAPFNGDQRQYDEAMRKRAQNQNEYNRIN